GLPANSSVAITFEANDDGLPDPPAALTYTIQSLPENGRLFGAGFGLIQNAPHNLPAGVNSVSYTANLGYTGADSFTFTANDGGVAPDGGDSNIATVSVTVGVPQLVYE